MKQVAEDAVQVKAPIYEQVLSGAARRKAEPMNRLLVLAVFAISAIFIASGSSAEEIYRFDDSEIEKKPYHFGGYVEFKPVLYRLDQDSASYKLRFYDDPQGNALAEANGRVQMEGSYEKGIYRLYARTNTDLKYSDPAGSSERSVFYEAYGSLKPSQSLRIDAGKKTMKWGKGYAWTPVSFVDRPKDPDDPELAMEGFIVGAADYIRSFDGPLKTFSFTPVLLPVYNHINDDFGNGDKLNFAGRFYFLLYDTDIDLLFMTGGSRPDRYGVDFSRNVTSSFEIHGEYAYVRNTRKAVPDSGGIARAIESDAQSCLAGIRHLTTFDLTTIVEYYHNGAGFSEDDRMRFFSAVDRAYDLYQATGKTAALSQARTLADTFGRAGSGRDYLYARLSQKEPFNIVYFTPALTWMMNLGDRSSSLTPELLYTGFTNWELRFRTAFLIGGKDTEFGGKQNDCRIELRVGYYF